MTKSATIVILFFVFLITLGIIGKSAFAEYILRPVPDQPGINKLEFVDSAKPAENFSSFGDLLDPKPTAPLASSSGDIEKVQKLKSLLSQISDNSNLQNRVLSATTNNYNYYSIHPTPSPYPPKDSYLVPDASSLALTRGEPSGQATFQPVRNVGNVANNPVKTTYTLAVLGDSMVDTLGKDLPDLKALLKTTFPEISFALLNFGQGATDLESGIRRLTETTKYLDEVYPPLLSYKPDIIVIESFAYNHWSSNSYDLDRQWLDFDKIVKLVKEKSPGTKIIFAATIAPNNSIYGDDKLNWTKDAKWQASQTTKMYLENLVNFASSQNYPLADAYHPSLGPDGNGQIKYINGGDHLHPSEEGKVLFAQKVVEAIRSVLRYP